MLHIVCRSDGLPHRSRPCGSDFSVSHGYLKMWIAHTFRNLLKQRFLDFLELRWLDNVENLLDFPQEHDLVISKEMQETE